HLRIEGTWTITGTTGGEPPSVNVDSSWMGTYTLMKNDTYQRTFCVGYEDLSIMTSITGSGTGTQQFIISPTDPDPNQFTVGFIPATPLNVIQLSGGTHRTQCNTPPTDQAASGTVDDSVTAMLSALPVLTPDPGNPDHYAGRNTSSHVERPGIGGAPHVTDS